MSCTAGRLEAMALKKIIITWYSIIYFVNMIADQDLTCTLDWGNSSAVWVHGLFLYPGKKITPGSRTALVSYALLSPNAEEALVVRIFGVKHIEQ